MTGRGANISRRAANLRSALLLVVLALVFFIAVMVKYKVFAA